MSAPVSTTEPGGLAGHLDGFVRAVRDAAQRMSPGAGPDAERIADEPVLGADARTPHIVGGE